MVDFGDLSGLNPKEAKRQSHSSFTPSVFGGVTHLLRIKSKKQKVHILLKNLLSGQKIGSFFRHPMDGAYDYVPQSPEPLSLC